MYNLAWFLWNLYHWFILAMSRIISKSQCWPISFKRVMPLGNINNMENLHCSTLKLSFLYDIYKRKFFLVIALWQIRYVQCGGYWNFLFICWILLSVCQFTVKGHFMHVNYGRQDLAETYLINVNPITTEKCPYSL